MDCRARAFRLSDGNVFAIRIGMQVAGGSGNGYEAVVTGWRCNSPAIRR